MMEIFVTAKTKTVGTIGALLFFSGNNLINDYPDFKQT